jgi:hypothetical protein
VVREFLAGQLTRRDVTLVLTPMVLHEFVHVVSDPRRFEPPVAMAEALGLARLYLGRANIECLSTDAEALAHAFDLVDRHQLGRKQAFSGLQLVDPRTPDA